MLLCCLALQAFIHSSRTAEPVNLTLRLQLVGVQDVADLLLQLASANRVSALDMRQHPPKQTRVPLPLVQCMTVTGSQTRGNGLPVHTFMLPFCSCFCATWAQRDAHNGKVRTRLNKFAADAHQSQATCSSYH